MTEWRPLSPGEFEALTPFEQQVLVTLTWLQQSVTKLQVEIEALQLDITRIKNDVRRKR